MGIGKGKSDKIYIDGLIESSGNEGKILQVEHSLAENIAELKQTSAALNAAIDRMESIVSKIQLLCSRNAGKENRCSSTSSNPKILE